MKEAGLLAPKAKCQKLNANGEVGTAQELNDLPEGILLHILSFLPTRDAVKTSLLSKRWEYLWPCMSKLYFHHYASHNLSSTTRFLNIVDRAFVLRDSSSMDTFSIGCSSDDDVVKYRLRTGIAGAIRHKVQKLFLDCRLDAVPSSVYICKTLTELHLSWPLPELPRSLCLANLKVLDLTILKPLDSISLQKLFSLPFLEELTLHCRLKDSKAISITAPKLRKLSMCCCSFHADILDGLKVLIDGSRLRFFEYSGIPFFDLCISAACVVVTAIVTISYSGFEPRERFGERVHKLLTALSNARFLSLSFDGVEVLRERSELVDSLPLFSNLTVLKFERQYFSFDHRAPLQILTKFPNLASLQFNGGIELTKPHNEYDWILDPVPPCFLSKLKNITIRRFHCVSTEKIVLSILLRAARVLKEMDIHVSPFFRKCKKNERAVLEALKALPRESQDCIFIVHSQ